MDKKERIVWLDVAKGIAIILMVLGHSGLPSVINSFIFAFHMPFFFFASGLVTNFGLPSSDFARRKVIGLIKPFIGYSLILILLTQFLTDDKMRITISGFLSEGCGDWALWFVPVLFLSLMITKLIANIKSKIKYVLVLLLPCISGMLYYYHVNLPWKISVVPYASFLLFLSSEKVSRRFVKVGGGIFKEMILCALFAIITFAISLYWRMDMAQNRVLPFVQLLTGAITGSLMLIMISKIISRNQLLTKIMTKIGRETYLIMALSQIVVVYINIFFEMNPAIKYLLAIIALIICYYIKEMTKRLFKMMKLI